MKHEKGDVVAEGRVVLEPVLESVLRYCLKDARERMEKGQAIAPFSALAVGDKLFMEQHPANTPAESHAQVRKTVEGARGAQAYGFCYDGYIDTDDGRRDCLIAEGGTPGSATGHAIGLLYTVDGEGAMTFEDEPVYVSTTLNYMINLAPEEPADESPADPADEPVEGD